jgi:GNAT superfamily N-acetyltransferase
MSITIRPAVSTDAALIHRFIHELAEYEKLLDKVLITVAGVEAMLFAPQPRAFCEIADVDGKPVGFALWFYSVSTFEGHFGLYLEDLYVRPQARGAGVGRALLARLARRCVDENLKRMEWTVLDWNALAIRFYDSLGATAKTEWITRQLRGDALERLAASET